MTQYNEPLVIEHFFYSGSAVYILYYNFKVDVK